MYEPLVTVTVGPEVLDCAKESGRARRKNNRDRNIFVCDEYLRTVIGSYTQFIVNDKKARDVSSHAQEQVI